MIDSLLKYLGKIPKLSLANTGVILGMLVTGVSWTLNQYEAVRDYKAQLEERWAWSNDEIHELRDRVWMLEHPNDPWTAAHKDDYNHK